MEAARQKLQKSADAALEQAPELEEFHRLTALLELDLRVQLRHGLALLSRAEERQRQAAGRREHLAGSIADCEGRLERAQRVASGLEQEELPQGRREVCYWEEQGEGEKGSCAVASLGGGRDSLRRQQMKVSLPSFGHCVLLGVVVNSISCLCGMMIVQLQSCVRQLESEVADLTARCVVLEVEEDGEDRRARHLQGCEGQAEGRVAALRGALLADCEGEEEGELAGEWNWRMRRRGEREVRMVGVCLPVDSRLVDKMNGGGSGMK